MGNSSVMFWKVCLFISASSNCSASFAVCGMFCSIFLRFSRVFWAFLISFWFLYNSVSFSSAAVFVLVFGFSVKCSRRSRVLSGCSSCISCAISIVASGLLNAGSSFSSISEVHWLFFNVKSSEPSWFWAMYFWSMARALFFCSSVVYSCDAFKAASAAAVLVSFSAFSGS